MPEAVRILLSMGNYLELVTAPPIAHTHLEILSTSIISGRSVRKQVLDKLVGWTGCEVSSYLKYR